MFRLIAGVALLCPFVAVAADFGDAVQGGKTAAQVCAACHGSDGNSSLPVNPVLAGQHAEYLYKQLKNFKSGERQNAAMMAMVAPLSDADMRNLAAYYAQQKPVIPGASDKDLVERGRQIFRGGIVDAGVAACSGCHSPNGAGVPIQFPRLAGQHAEYVATQLRAFRTGERANDPNQMMRMVAARLGDKDIEALAEYTPGLR